jgi:O-antigen ligase
LSTRPVALPRVGPTPVIAAAGLGAAVIIGLLTAHRVPLGMGVLIGLLYAPLVLLNFRVGLALFVGLVFIRFLPALSVGPNAAGILVLVGWIGTVAEHRAILREFAQRFQRLLTALVVLLGWVSLSALWATTASYTTSMLLTWVEVTLLFLIVATTPRSRRTVELLIWAFVGGAVLSVMVGLATSGLHSSASAIDTATQGEGRLSGGQGDPNFLAAGLVPAIALAAGLTGTTRNVLARWSLLVAGALLTVGLAATESRGGLVAATAMLIAAVIFYKRRRAQVLLFFAVAVSIGAVWFTTSPDAWHRVTNFNGGGNGRSDLWKVAWQAGQDHPILGVGLNNFRVVSPKYVRKPGTLHFVDLIAEKPHVVHNTYLQMFTETGIVGLGLFLFFVGACVRSAAKAAKRFDELGERALAGVARAVLVGTLGMLTAAFFISTAGDFRLWILLAFSPALLALAMRPQSELAE